MELDDSAGEADQDRGESGLAIQDPDVPDGRGGRAPDVVRGDPGSHRFSATRSRDGLSVREGVERRCGGNRDGERSVLRVRILAMGGVES